MNARGIPTAAYQVLHLLSCTGGIPHLGYPPCPDLAGDSPSRGAPHLMYPLLDLAGVPSCQTWLGYSPSDLAGVPPIRPGYPPPLDLAGVPPPLDLAGVYPLPIWTWPGYLAPPPRCGQTDRHVSKHNLPVVLRTRSVNILGSDFILPSLLHTLLQKTR